MSAFLKVAKTGEVAPGAGKVVEAGGKRIAIFNIDGTFYAIGDTCTHRGGPLSEGMVVGTEVTLGSGNFLLVLQPRYGVVSERRSLAAPQSQVGPSAAGSRFNFRSPAARWTPANPAPHSSPACGHGAG